MAEGAGVVAAVWPRQEEVHSRTAKTATETLEIIEARVNDLKNEAPLRTNAVRL